MTDDIQAEALRIVRGAEARGVTLRLLGGLAVRIHAPSATRPPLARACPDIDLAAPARQGPAAEQALAELGYLADRSFNLLNGAERLLFYDEACGRKLDIFVGDFAMCHRLPLNQRLANDAPTLPLAELLLTKLQIVQINQKDLQDIWALLLDHPLGDGDDETIKLPRVSELCAGDWGLWRTATLNLGRSRDRLGEAGLDVAARRAIGERIDELLGALERAPKSLGWKLRAAVGERVRWYELPEEIEQEE